MDNKIKEYQVNGVFYVLNDCPASRTKSFQKEYAECKSDCEKIAELAKSCVTLKKRLTAEKSDKRSNEELLGFPEPDFVTEVDMDIISEIIEDFFLKFNPIYGGAMRSLRKSERLPTKTEDLNKKNGQNSGSENSELKTQ